MHSAVFRKLCGLLVCGLVPGAVGCVDLFAQNVKSLLTTTAVGYTTATESPKGSASTPVNGVCGSATGAAANTAPTSALCSGGTATAPTGTGPWSWQCTGSNGGTTASCAAPTVIPESVSAFVQSLGVNTHLAFPNTPYFDRPGSVVSALQYLGLPNVRDLSLANTDSISTAMNNAVAAAGFKFDALLVGSGDVELGQNLASISAFLGANPGAVVAIEGPNEINDEPITYGALTDTYAAGVLVTQDLWTAVQNNPSLKGIPIYALTLAGGIDNLASEVARLGDLAPYVTYGNAHVYACCSNNMWQYDMGKWLPLFEADTPGKPVVITETGYETIPSAVDAIAAAKYNLNIFFQDALNGIVSTYLFELVDESSTFTFGLFNSDWTPKPGATAIHNMITILQGAGTGSATGTVNYSVSGLPATGYSLLLGGSKAFDIAVWIDATIYNPKTATDIVAPAYTATVNLGASFANVAVYDPTIGTTPIATYSNVSSLEISVTDHPLIVQAS
jgi:trimeric autotransporter adhesin